MAVAWVFGTGRKVSRVEGVAFVQAHLAYLGTIIAVRA